MIFKAGEEAVFPSVLNKFKIASEFPKFIFLIAEVLIIEDDGGVKLVDWNFESDKAISGLKFTTANCTGCKKEKWGWATTRALPKYMSRLLHALSTTFGERDFSTGVKTTTLQFSYHQYLGPCPNTGGFFENYFIHRFVYIDHICLESALGVWETWIASSVRDLFFHFYNS